MERVFEAIQTYAGNTINIGYLRLLKSPNFYHVQFSGSSGNKHFEKETFRYVIKNNEIIILDKE